MGLRKGLVNFRYRLVLQVSDDDRSFDLTGKRTAALLQADGDISSLRAAVRRRNRRGGAPTTVAVPLESGDDNPGVLGELPALAALLNQRNSASR